MLFWIIAMALAAAIALWLARATLLGRPVRDDSGADVQVYRDQLAEIERDLARGVTNEAEAERARIEVSRRLLEADRAGHAATATAQGRPVLPIALVTLALAGGIGVYLQTGAPGYPDLPIADRIARAEELYRARPAQDAAAAAFVAPERPAPDPQFLELMTRLRSAVAEKPDDLTGQRLLARNEAALGNYDAAIAAQRKVIELSGDAVTASDFAALADDYILATGGYVSPEAEEALARTLSLDPGNGAARFYMGLMWAQTGRPDRAFRIWRTLLEQGPEDAPWIPMIRADIGLLARASGVDYAPPPAAGARGPDAGQVAAAADMTPEERQEMIRGMVDQLSDRLASEGGPATEWARLITSLGILGETARARAIWEEAEARFAGQAGDIATLRAAAEQAGVAE